MVGYGYHMAMFSIIPTIDNRGRGRKCGRKKWRRSENDVVGYGYHMAMFSIIPTIDNRGEEGEEVWEEEMEEK